MDGYGKVEQLPDSLNKVFDDVYIFHGNSTADEEENGGIGKWEQLRPGHGGGFYFDGKENYPSGNFGIEMSFAAHLKALYPNERIAIIKYARGGSSIDSLAKGEYGCWEPDYVGTNGINQYDHFLSTLNYAMSVHDIDGDGQSDELLPSGILWMQGESDSAFSIAIANRYEQHLKRLMDLIRASFRNPDLPVVIGKISDSGQLPHGKVWRYAELVQHAQEQFVEKDKNAAIVRDTNFYSYSDPYHYDGPSYLLLGIAFAEALDGLLDFDASR
jgi:hypothetical protein